jgi:hypothetical protein
VRLGRGRRISTTVQCLGLAQTTGPNKVGLSLLILIPCFKTTVEKVLKNVTSDNKPMLKSFKKNKDYAFS